MQPNLFQGPIKINRMSARNYFIGIALLALLGTGCPMGSGPNLAPPPGGGGNSPLNPDIGGTGGPTGGSTTAGPVPVGEGSTGGVAAGMSGPAPDEPENPTDVAAAPAAGGSDGSPAGGGEGPGSVPGPAADPGSAAKSAGVMNETPISVIGSPMPFTPRLICPTSDFTVFFHEVGMARTDQVTSDGTSICQIKGFLARREEGSVGDVGVSLVSVALSDSGLPGEVKGSSRTLGGGCFQFSITCSEGRTAHLAANYCSKEASTDLPIPQNIQDSPPRRFEPCPLLGASGNPVILPKNKTLLKLPADKI